MEIDFLVISDLQKRDYFQPELIALAGAGAVLVFLWLRRDNHRDDDGPNAFTFSADVTDEEKRPFCAVCLNGICGGERCRKLSACGHCFHVDCVDAWLQSHSTCPLCRAQVSDHVFRREFEGGVLDLLVSWSEMVLEKICSPLNEELSSMVRENVMFVTQL
nr:E3 ubiquitin-protein ligase ATL6-like [Ipomoea batatas]